MTWKDKLELGLKDDAAARRDNLPPDEVHGPEEPSGPGRSPVVTEVRDKQQPADSSPEKPGLKKDDVAEAQSADMESEGQGQRHDTHVTKEQSPVGVGVDAQMPNTMPRGEDDIATRAGSRDFHDQAGSGHDTSRRQLFFAPAQ
jgi:hypothetical protein